jgi:hypothetical protein
VVELLLCMCETLSSIPVTPKKKKQTLRKEQGMAEPSHPWHQLAFSSPQLARVREAPEEGEGNPCVELGLAPPNPLLLVVCGCWGSNLWNWVLVPRC